jgi:hypothetical protein
MTPRDLEEARMAAGTSTRIAETAGFADDSKSPGFDSLMAKLDVMVERTEALAPAARPASMPLSPAEDDPSQIPWAIGALVLTLGLAGGLTAAFTPGAIQMIADASPIIGRVMASLLVLLIMMDLVSHFFGVKGPLHMTADAVMGALSGKRRTKETPSAGPTTFRREVIRPSAKLIELVRRDADDHVHSVEASLASLSTAWKAVPHALDPMAEKRVGTILRQATDLTDRLDRTLELADPEERRDIVLGAIGSIRVLAAAADEERRAILGVARDALDQQRRYIEISHPKDGPLTPIG